MTTAKLTSKGQVTIPKTVRKSLGLQTGDRIAFVIRGEAEVALKPLNKSVDEVFGKLHDPARPSRTVEEMKEAVAGKMGKRG